MKNVKIDLKNWSKHKFVSLDRELKEFREAVVYWEKEANARTLSTGEIERWMEAPKEWLEKEKVKNCIKRQRARVKIGNGER